MHPSNTITDHFRLSEFHKKALKKLHLETIEDLLYHLPARYDTLGESTREIAQVEKGEKVVLYGTMSKPEAKKAWRKKIPMAEGFLKDDSGRIKLVWFNQPYIAKMYPDGTPVKIEGSVSERNGELYLSNPSIERVSTLPTGAVTGMFADGEAPTLFPFYPESRGVTSRWFYHTIQKVFTAGALDTIEDPIPDIIREKYNLPDLKTALLWAHTPKTTKNTKAARKRFAFEEIFYIQLKKHQDRRQYDESPSFEIKVDDTALGAFTKRFPFTPTGAQDKAVEEIIRDISTPHAMSRLLEGDVGSGKTYVAAVTAHTVATSKPKGQDFGNLQVAYMAPTEILAKQHFESFIEYFKNLPIQIGLITGSGCRKFPSKVNPNTWTDISRTQLLKWVKNGEIPILVGTHALIQKTVTFKHLAYVIIDEQHRFGTRQRALLAQKPARTERGSARSGGDKDKELPHLLSMTATPIPRTLALTIFGDLDLTLLDEMPKGRKEVQTSIVPKEKRDDVYTHIREALNEGRQAYVICPRISEPDPKKENALQTKSVKEEAKRLQQDIFSDKTVGILHGAMRPKEKDEVMQTFAKGEIDILVATSVVEVGVNVQNATIIVIEGAERFGLAQLHQLRGRVLRSTHQAHCYLFTDTKSKETMHRLKALEEAHNGFELAERDLTLRGSGELYGGRQWGVSDIGMEAIKNIKMVEAARTEAQTLVAKDPILETYPLLAKRVSHRGELHFE